MRRKFSDFIESSYLDKKDVTDGAITATIKDLETREVGAACDVKNVLIFETGTKPMILNKTNILILEKIFGNDIDNAIGNEVEIYLDKTVTYKGNRIGGLRIREIMA